MIERAEKKKVNGALVFVVGGEDAAADDRALIGREEEMKGHRLCGFRLLQTR